MTTRLKRPLDPATVQAADNRFYSEHPEMIRNGSRVAISETNPAHAQLREEWLQEYQRLGGEVEDKQPVPSLAPGAVIQPCPLAGKKRVDADPVSVMGGNSGEAILISEAQAHAKQMIDSAINNCLESAKTKPNPLVAKYFGISGTSEEDQAKIGQIVENYKKTGAGFDQVAYEVEHEEYKPGESNTVAYARTLPVVHGVGKVHVVYPAFENQSFDDRARTLVHEMSHYEVGTDDHAYDWQTSKWGKLTQAEKMDNAENYGDFARDCYRANH